MSSGIEINGRFTTVEINGGRESTNSKSGSLIIRKGGLGVAGNINIGGNITVPEGTVITGGIQIPTSAVIGHVLRATSELGDAAWTLDEDYRILNGVSGDVSFHTGNFGFGVTSPLEQVHLSENLRVDGDLRLAGDMSFPNDSDVSINNFLTFNTDKLIVAGNGYIGVGVTPNESIHTLGNIRLGGIIHRDTENFTLPVNTDLLIGVSSTNTVHNKTLTSPIITGSMDFESSGRINNLITPINSDDAATKGYVDGLIVGLDWQGSVKSKNLTAPPGSPVEGDRYIIAVGGSGDWAGHDNKIAEWNGSNWNIIPPTEGTATLVESLDKQYNYNGSEWVLFGTLVNHVNLIGLLDDDHTQYVLLEGRTGGQVMYGGKLANEDLTIFSTEHSTRGNVLLNSDGGSVGIGITSPTSTLHVNGDIGIKNVTVVSNTGNDLNINANADVIAIKPNGNANAQVLLGVSGNTEYYNSSGVLTNKLSTFEDSYIGLGSLGIGTNVVASRMTVGSTLDTIDNEMLIQSTMSSGLTLQSNLLGTTGSDVSSITLVSKNTKRAVVTQIGDADGILPGTVADSMLIGSIAAGEMGDMYLATGGNLTVSIKEDSKVGVNQILPNAGIVLKDNLDPHSGLTIGCTGDTGIKIGQSAGEYLDIKWVYSDTTPRTEITTQNASAPVILQSNSGSVGIGTISPDETLHVIGNIKLTGTINRDTDVFTLPASTDVLVARDSTDIITNKSLEDSSTLIIGAVDNTKELAVSIVGASTGTRMTLTSSHTDNRTIIIPDASDTLVARDTTDVLTNKTLTGNVMGSFTNTGTYTMPSGTSDTIVARNTVDTLQNKTIVSPVIQGNMIQDANVYISTNEIRGRDADGLILTDDSGNGIFIEDGGNVGIGITNPTTVLHVVGDAVTVDADLIVDTDVLRVDTTLNRVGINTDAPTEALHVIGNVQMDNNLVVEGDLVINGSQIIANTTNSSVQDNLVKWADGNPADTLDIGFFGSYADTGVTKYTGFFRDASGSNEYRLFTGLEVLPDNTVDISATGYIKGDLILGGLDMESVTYSTDLTFNTDQFVITSSGDVGIGIASPGRKFNVIGNAKLGTELYTQDGKIGVNKSVPVAELDIVGSTKITGTANGSLTGTADPNGTTTLVGSGTLFLTELSIGDQITVNGETRTVSAIASNTSLTVNTAFSDTVSTGITKKSADLIVQNSSGNVDFIVQESGNVGIGTYASGYPLAVCKSSPGNWSSQIKNGESVIHLAHADGLGASINTGTLTDTSYGLLVLNNSSTLLRVQNDNKIGIATNSPDELLHVHGSSVGDGARIANAKLGVWSENVNYTALIHNDLKATGNSYALAQFNTGETYLNAASTKSIHFSVNHVQQAVITSAGRLGVGTVTPQQQLHVEGSGRINGDLEVTGNVIVQGDSVELNAETITVDDPVLKLANGNSGDILDIGIYGEYNDGTQKFAGLFRDKDDSKFKLFNGLEVEPGTTQVDFGGTGYTDADLLVGGLEASGTVVFGKSIRVAVTTVTSNTVLSDEHHIVICDCTSGDITITIPEVHDNIPALIGIKYTIVKKDNTANKVIVAMTNNDIIDAGLTTIDMTDQTDRMTIVAIGGASNIGTWLTV